MKWTYGAVVAALLVAGRANAEEPQQAATKAMHEAMAQHADLPATQPRLPGHEVGEATPGTQSGADHRGQAHEAMKARHEQVKQQHSGKAHGADAEHAAQHRSQMHGTKDAATMHAEAANRAAMGAMMGGSSSASGQASGECQNAAGMGQTMKPGSMMGSGGKMGGNGGDMGGGMNSASGGGSMTSGSGSGEMSGGKR